MNHQHIRTRQELSQLAHLLGLSPDWREPDEREVDVQIKGVSFDNAGAWGPDFDTRHADGSKDFFREISVIIRHEDQPVAEVNLADLFAWATGHQD